MPESPADRRGLLASVVVVLVLSGCATAGNGDGATVVPTVVSTGPSPGASASAPPDTGESRMESILLRLRQAAGSVQSCMEDEGFQARISVSDSGELSNGGTIPPEFDPEKFPDKHDAWVRAMNKAYDTCGDKYRLGQLQEEIRQIRWVASPADRAGLWARFLECIKKAGFAAVPEPTMAEYPIGKMLLAANPDKEGSLFACKDETLGLWPTLTSKGDPRSTIIGTGIDP